MGIIKNDTADNIADDISISGDVKQIIERLTVRNNICETYLEELTESGETQMSLTDPDEQLMKKRVSFPSI